MRPPQGFEWLLILFIILLLFGAKRLPDMARGLGRSMRILKAETRGLSDDDAASDEKEQVERSERPAVTDQPKATDSGTVASDSAERAPGGSASA
jgi:sec-independent protein translocase protein TatA